MSAERTDLDNAASSTGTEWAAEAVRACARANRAAVGGWPGTLSEARVRLQARVPSLGVVPDGERERLVRRTYEAARSAWRAQAGRDGER